MDTRGFILLALFVFASLARSYASSRFTAFAKYHNHLGSDSGSREYDHDLKSQQYFSRRTGGESGISIDSVGRDFQNGNTFAKPVEDYVRYGGSVPKSEYNFDDNLEPVDYTTAMPKRGGSIGSAGIFDAMRFGAVGNGVVDDSQAFLKAWEAACGSSGSPVLFVPKRTFLLKPITFKGPCRSPISIKIMGRLVAPNSKSAWHGFDYNNWIEFSDVNNVIIDGSGFGEIDGQGAAWWKQCNTQDCVRPVALRLHKMNNVQLKALRLVDSAKGHIGVNDCSYVAISDLTIIAPQNSPNTDGIDISGSTHVSIDKSVMSTGDDCVAINGGTSIVNITNVMCGPGHGISIGSLGGNGGFDTVEEVRVQSCMFHGTENGARIKTWQGGSGYARKIAFSDIKFVDVKNPIIIDQNYCGGGHGCASKNTGSSSVEVSDVTFSGLRGTSANQEAITLRCAANGCKNIVLHDINILPVTPNLKLTTLCSNVEGRMFRVAPNVPCLAPTFV